MSEMHEPAEGVSSNPPALDAGMRAWENGEPFPPMPEGDKIDTPEALFWLGYMFRRAQDFFRRREMALYPDTVEPRP